MYNCVSYITSSKFTASFICSKAEEEEEEEEEEEIKNCTRQYSLYDEKNK